MKTTIITEANYREIIEEINRLSKDGVYFFDKLFPPSNIKLEVIPITVKENHREKGVHIITAKEHTNKLANTSISSQIQQSTNYLILIQGNDRSGISIGVTDGEEYLLSPEQMLFLRRTKEINGGKEKEKVVINRLLKTTLSLE